MRSHHLLCWLDALTVQHRPKQPQTLSYHRSAITAKKQNLFKWLSVNYEDGRTGVNKAKEELPWNVDWELVLTAELWVTVGVNTEVERDWGREEEEEEDRSALRERDEGWTWFSCEERWELEEGKTLTGPWTKSLKSSLSSEKPDLGSDGEGWAWACVEKLNVEEVDEEEGAGKEAGAPKGPWKSLNSSLSSHKAGGREWVVTEGCDGDDSAKMKK